jgi:hypothetical protein
MKITGSENMVYSIKPASISIADEEQPFAAVLRKLSSDT